MSKTPILTKKQQKSSLSAKKTKTKETIRNVLASPYSKYWPLVSNDHYQTIKTVLHQYLPKLLPDKVKIPWKELMKVPKSERRKFREEYVSAQVGTDCLKNNTEPRDGLVLGINDVTKALENGEAKSVLITEDVLPRLMVEHVIDQAVLLRIPLLVVPELRNILKEKCNISSIAVAFSDCSKYKLVHETIEDLSKQYPIPKNHINFNRAQELTDDSIIIIDDSIINNNISRENLTDVVNISEDEATKNTENENLEDSNIANVHLIRVTKDKRVFIPEKISEEHKKKDKMDVDTSGFLSFSNATDRAENIGKKYESLKVKRIKGDTNRNKRKIQVMKERKNKGKNNKRPRKS